MLNLTFDPWVWIAAFLTLCIYSFLYKDNPFYKFAEHIFVGVAMGYTISLTYHNQLLPNVIYPLIRDITYQWHLMIAIFIGLLYFGRFIPKMGWTIRIPIAMSLGFGMGVYVPLDIQTSLYKHIKFTMLPLFSGDIVLTTVILNLIIIIGVFSCLVYFYFSIRHVGAIYSISRLGIIFLMIGFGASFGNTVMARVSLLIGRVSFLLNDWLGLPTIM